MSDTQQTHRYWLSFDVEKGKEPLIYRMSRQFDVVFNVRQATMSNTVCVMAMEFTGERETIKAVVQWFEDQGVDVEPVEISTIEG